MSAFKRLVKACVRPLYSGLKYPSRPVMCRLRNFFIQPLEGPVRTVCERVEVIGGQMDVLAPLVRTMGAQFEALNTQVAQGFANQQSNLAQSMQAQMRGVQEVMLETDRLVLALLKAPAVPPPEVPAPAVQSVPLGEHRILVTHPTASFLYLDTRNLHRTPRILFGDHAQAVLGALGHLVGLGDRVVEVGAGEGYFTLALAHRVGPEGMVQVVEADPVARDLLHTNLQAHGLTPCVELIERPEGWRETLADAERSPALVCLDAPGQEEGWLPVLSSLVEANSSVRLLIAVHPFLAARGGLPGVLERLVGLGLRLWWIEADGFLMPVEPEQVLATPMGTWGHFVAARTMD